jgi:hypothetical protein
MAKPAKRAIAVDHGVAIEPCCPTEQRDDSPLALFGALAGLGVLLLATRRV